MRPGLISGKPPLFHTVSCLLSINVFYFVTNAPVIFVNICIWSVRISGLVFALGCCTHVSCNACRSLCCWYSALLHLVSVKKRATLFLTITLMFLDKLLIFVPLQTEIDTLQRIIKCVASSNYVSTLPGQTKKQKQQCVLSNRLFIIFTECRSVFVLKSYFSLC